MRKILPNTTIKILTTIAVFSLLSSCKSSKTVAVILQNPKEELLKKIHNTSFDYYWFSAKAKVRLESTEIKGGGRVNLRMVRDSIIWFNFKKVSIEGARGLISPKEFTILYRTEKKYERGHLNELFNSQTVSISFEELQSFLSGTVPLPFSTYLTYKNENNRHILEGQNETYNLTYYFDEDLTLKQYTMTDNQNRILNVIIGNLDEDLGIFKERKLTYYQNQKKAGTLNVDLSNIEINVPKKLPFTIPDHYSQY